MTAELPEAWRSIPPPATAASDCPRDPSLIGSSDIAAIVAHYVPELTHMAKWRNVSDLYLRCVHGIDQSHPPSKRQLARGLREEEPLREVYRQSIGPVSGPVDAIIHPQLPWACASPDGFADMPVVELKTHSVWHMEQWGPSGSDLVPDKYGFQAQWLMGVTQRPTCHILMGFGQDMTDEDGEEFFAWGETRLYVLHFDAELFTSCEVMAERFFKEHVSAKIPPALKPVHNRRKWKALTNGTARTSDTENPGAQTR